MSKETEVYDRFLQLGIQLPSSTALRISNIFLSIESLDLDRFRITNPFVGPLKDGDINLIREDVLYMYELLADKPEVFVLDQLSILYERWKYTFDKGSNAGEKETPSDVIRHSQLMKDYYSQLIELYKSHSKLFIYDDENRSLEGGTLRINGDYQGYEGQLVFGEGLIYFQRGTLKPSRSYICLASVDEDSLLEKNKISDILKKGGITPLWGIYWTDVEAYKNAEDIIGGFIAEAQARDDQRREPPPVSLTFGNI